MGVRIQQLSADVANQIAAGEVIERPASVVKELLENAYDAMADAIQIEVDFGGLNRIRICDNGHGIVADDLPLALSAHATSKITQLNDLYSISSMGFRGEALASIASVSRLSLSSKPREQEHAMMICIEDSEFSIQPCARSNGTTIDVKDLFFNAPVRKTFLKSERTEFQAIEAVVKRFALSEPSIAVSLTHNGKTTLNLPAATCEATKRARIGKLLGRQFIDNAIEVNTLRSGLMLQGWLSSSAYQLSQNDKQWVYINKRMVKDKLIHHAIKQGYEGMLHPGKHPACLLYLTLSPNELDVNVHPTKHEVRFQNPRLVHDLITSQIASIVTIPPIDERYAPISLPLNHLREAYIKEPLVTRSVNVPPDELTMPLSTIEHDRSVTCHDIQAPINKLKTRQSLTFKKWIRLNPTFAIVFITDTPFLVDVVRLHARHLGVLLEAEPRPLKSRPLLVPVSYRMPSAAIEQLEHYQPLFLQAGIETQAASDNAVIIRSVPLLLPQLDVRACMQVLTSKTLLNQQGLIDFILTCQTIDALQLTSEDEYSLNVFIQHQVHSETYNELVISLDNENCQRMFKKGV